MVYVTGTDCPAAFLVRIEKCPARSVQRAFRRYANGEDALLIPDPLELVAQKSRELLDDQIGAYRSLFGKAGTLLGIQGLFLPIFIFVLERASTTLLILSMVPIVLMLWAMVLLIFVLKPARLVRGFNPEQFENVLGMQAEAANLFEVGSNKAAFDLNTKILLAQNLKYNQGVFLTIVAMILSVAVMVANSFTR